MEKWKKLQSEWSSIAYRWIKINLTYRRINETYLTYNAYYFIEFAKTYRSIRLKTITRKIGHQFSRSNYMFIAQVSDNRSGMEKWKKLESEGFPRGMRFSSIRERTSPLWWRMNDDEASWQCSRVNGTSFTAYSLRKRYKGTCNGEGEVSQTLVIFLRVRSSS